MDEPSDRSVSDVDAQGAESKYSDGSDKAATGIAGLDAILGGGLPRNHAYLIHGRHGAGKTTLGLQFCITGARQAERVLYVTTCESPEEIQEVARSHGWSLEGVTIHYHDVHAILGEEPDQSVFHPAEYELPRTIKSLLEVIERVDPHRLVIDSLTEIQLLAADPRRFRHQVLALKHGLAGRRCTTLFSGERHDREQPVQSIVHGVIELDQRASDYGPDRWRLRVAKLRGQLFASGYHDFRIRTGGLDVYPRLMAHGYHQTHEPEVLSSGVPELDTLFGGGMDAATATLFMGPAGTGKSIVAAQFAVAAARRGERTDMYIFDERLKTALVRANSLGLDLEGCVSRGLVDIRQIDPAEMTPGEFSHLVRRTVAANDTKLVIIDSLSGYLNAMPHERLLALYVHELLAYLNQMGVTVLMVMSQHGLPGTLRHSSFDLSYIADSVLLFHTFEHAGELRKAISMYKRRSGPHERALRELQFGAEGIRVGDALTGFEGIMTGTPHYIGKTLPDVGN